MGKYIYQRTHRPLPQTRYAGQSPLRLYLVTVDGREPFNPPSSACSWSLRGHLTTWDGSRESRRGRLRSSKSQKDLGGTIAGVMSGINVANQCSADEDTRVRLSFERGQSLSDLSRNDTGSMI